MSSQTPGELVRFVCSGDRQASLQCSPSPGRHRTCVQELSQRRIQAIGTLPGNRRERMGRSMELGAIYHRAPARLSVPVRHSGGGKRYAQTPGEVPGDGVVVQDELPTALDDDAVREALRPHPSANTAARFEHLYLDPGGNEFVGGEEAGESGTDDGDSHAGSMAGVMDRPNDKE